MTEENKLRPFTHTTAMVKLPTAVEMGKFLVVPLRDVVVFPHAVVSLLVGRAGSMDTVTEAFERKLRVVLLTQRDPTKEKPTKKDFYNVGTCANILRTVPLPDGTTQVVVEGICRARVVRLLVEGNKLIAEAELWSDSQEKEKRTEALMRVILKDFERYVSISPNLSNKVLLTVRNIEIPGHFADIVASNLGIKTAQKQQLLELFDPRARLTKLAEIMGPEIEILELQRDIESRVRRRVEKTQKDFYLKEQLKVIEEELGEPYPESPDLRDLKDKILKAKMSREAEKAALQEYERLTKMTPLSPQAAVSHNYIDWLISLPWNYKTKDNLNLKRAQRILDEDHYGLDEPKARIIEYLAVRKLTKGGKSPILCFVGPPGVGKTSLAKSIARSLGRRFVRKSLGGVRDEAEIRGHRRTYIGALPGRIIQSIRKAGSKNPVFLLDEIDKLSHDYRGDPCSALLEVLDPEENYAFSDHYLEVEFDLSDVFFIATANTEAGIPHVLRDRMEVIRLPGYSPHEKLCIAKEFLIPELLEEHGLKKAQVEITDAAINRIIHDYTREAGVRNLKRQLANLCRKLAKEVVASRRKRKFRITARNLHNYLGVPEFAESSLDLSPAVGSAIGLAYTDFGGKAICVEVTKMKGDGELTLTGKLGEVMKESAQAALSYVRANAELLGINPNFYQQTDIHVHVPEGATPKDGPSAGITMTIALISCLTERPARRDIAMTGEITLLGRVLPVGGIKEKILGAHREGIYEVILPSENEKDLGKLPAEIKRKMRVTFVKDISEVIPLVLGELGKRARRAGKGEQPVEVPVPPQ